METTYAAAFFSDNCAPPQNMLLLEKVEFFSKKENRCASFGLYEVIGISHNWQHLFVPLAFSYTEERGVFRLLNPAVCGLLYVDIPQALFRFGKMFIIPAESVQKLENFIINVSNFRLLNEI